LALGAGIKPETRTHNQFLNIFFAGR